MKQVDIKDGASADIVQGNIEQLKDLFPEVFTENGVNFDTLRQLLGDLKVLDEGEEKFGLNWHGKKQARQIALTPSLGTLLPCPEESVDWHTTQNLFIEGDNLEVLKLLQKSYANKVKMIYIDPPYNTGKEFVYPDKFQDNLDTYLKYTEQADENGHKFSSNTESSGRKHTNWLNMMYPRLKLAKYLLRQDGVIFISIDDNEQSNLKKLCDEIFGEENFIIQICHKSRASVSNDKIISPNHNIILAYAKNERIIFENRSEFGLDPNLDGFNRTDDLGEYKLVPVDGPGGAKKGNPYYTFEGVTGYWRFSEQTMREKFEKGQVVKIGNNLQQKYYKHNAMKSRKTTTSWWDEKFYTSEATKKLNNLLGENFFDTPKPVELIDKMLKLCVRNYNDIVLDFFAGSGTTAHAVMQLNAQDKGQRRFIMVQLPEPTGEKHEAYKAGYKNIADLAKERIRRAAKKIQKENPSYQGDLGFKVFKLASSNIKVWNPDRKNIEASLMEHKEHLVEGRSEQDILYELLLKRGVELTTPIETKQIEGKNVYSIGCGKIITCLDKLITSDEVIKFSAGISAWQKELKKTLDGEALETHVFFRDSAFRDDIAKTNMAANLYQNGINHVRSL